MLPKRCAPPFLLLIKVIGDFNGIIEKLDYIRELGCNAIWINPCFKSPFGDAGYDVEDYYTAAPRYGTNEDLEELFRQAQLITSRTLEVFTMYLAASLIYWIMATVLSTLQNHFENQLNRQEREPK